MIADRFGPTRVLCAGALMYSLGLVLMAHATSAPVLDLSAGLLIGFGLAGASFMVVLAAFGKILPPQWRSIAFGLGTASGSFGQFLFSPIAVLLMSAFGWQQTLVTFAVVVLAVLPLSLAFATPRSEATAHTAPQSLRQALAEAFAHRSYVLLTIGFFTCGFQIAFVTVHLPSYLVDRGPSAEVGGWTIGVIGLFNIVGSLTGGWLGDRMPKRYLLSLIYFGRTLAILAFILVPISPATCIAFGVFTGLLWLATVPPTNALIVVMFGTRWLRRWRALPSSATRSAASSAPGSVGSCSTAPGRMSRCGSWRSCSGSSRRSSICRSSRSRLPDRPHKRRRAERRPLQHSRLCPPSASSTLRIEYVEGRREAGRKRMSDAGAGA
jgi:MFS family permease